MTSDGFIKIVGEAIARMEGYYNDISGYHESDLKHLGIKYVMVNGEPQTVAKAFNNPGNIMGAWGRRRVSKDGFVIFESTGAGFAALYHQISKCADFYKVTFREFFAGQRDAHGDVIPGKYPGYAPAADGINNPENYAQFVCDEVNRHYGKQFTPDQRLIDASDELQNTRH